MIDRAQPTRVVDLKHVAELVGKEKYTCVRLTDGTVKCWGSNEMGQLGDGTHTDRALPTTVSALTGVAEIAIGARHACARLSDGTAKCWGRNYDYQLGDGTDVDRQTPTTVRGLTRVAHLAIGRANSCALLVDGTVKCWGSNHGGVLGYAPQGNGGSFGEEFPGIFRHTQPMRVPELSGVAQLAIGDFHACARLSDGTVRCWGSNRFGEIGEGTQYADSYGRQVKVLGLTGADQVVLAPHYSCAQLANGTIAYWGHFGSALDDDSQRNPIIVADLADVAQIAVSQNHSCVLLGDGAVKCRGSNASGQLGDGTTTDRPSWTLVKW
ncbi:MAG: hypothetical protein NVSMB1_14200 [Polyangiales bacterium]